MKTLRTGETAAAVCAAAGLSEDALAMLAEDQAPREYVESLIAGALHADAAVFLAHVLPRRESVWWAWSCARDAAGDAPDPDVASVLEATRQWIVEPSDGNRRAAGAMAEALGYDSAAGMTGFAAFMCGETLAPIDVPEDTPPAPAPPGAVAKAIAGAIHMAAAAGDPAGIGARFGQFIARGVERADKGLVWTPAADAGDPE